MLVAAGSAAQNAALAAGESPFAISVTCRSNPGCIFKGEKLFASIAVENRSEKDVYLTTKYMKSRGPEMQITDVKTREAHYTHVRVGDYDLLADYELIPAKGKIVMDDVIMVDDITTYRKHLVALDVEVSFAGKWKFATGKTQPLNVKGHFTILGEDTLARRSGIKKQ